MVVASDVIYMVVIAMETPRGFNLSKAQRKFIISANNQVNRMSGANIVKGRSPIDRSPQRL